MNEEWKPIPGLEGRYSASSLGRIRRDLHEVADVTRGRVRARILPERIVAGVLDEAGYRRTMLRVNGKLVHRRFHQLVALAFLGRPPEGKTHVNHKDEDKGNNRPENLEWCSNFENALHSLRRRHERGTRGFPTKNAKLTEEQVREIRRRLADGERREQLAVDYCVSYATVTDIALRRRWSYLR